jgi:hypothetical protein
MRSQRRIWKEREKNLSGDRYSNRYNRHGIFRNMIHQFTEKEVQNEATSAVFNGAPGGIRTRDFRLIVK